MPETIIKMTDGVIRQQQNTILKDVNIEIQSGEFIYLIGKVGSGKSSLLKTLYAELPLEFGNAEVVGFQLKKIKKSQIPLLRRKCGIVFQDFKLLIDRNVYNNLEFVLRATGWKNKKAIKERIETVLNKVGMLNKQQQMPHQLSGGEQQRIVLARALLNAPPLILADEPTGNIDPETSYRLVELLKEICETGKTIIIATHQYDLIEKYPGRVFCCENGVLFEKTKVMPCECTENTPDPATETAISVAEESMVIPEAIENTEIPETPEEITLPVEEPISEHTTEAIAATEEMVAPDDYQNFSSTTAEIPSGEEKKDTIKLIGKLDYPEITSFDYELESRPTILAEEEEKVARAHEETSATLSHSKEVTTEEGSTEICMPPPEELPETPEDKKKPPIIDLELID